MSAVFLSTFSSVVSYGIAGRFSSNVSGLPLLLHRDKNPIDSPECLQSHLAVLNFAIASCGRIGFC